jgi:D-serine deaminase-like pyridoxal phosphate-dependent protein
MFSAKQEAAPVLKRVRAPNEALIGEPGSRHRLSTPALVLDVEVMESNIALMAARAREKRYNLRPVAKIHKSVEIARRQVAAGGIGMCCSTIAECELMVNAGIPGVMLFAPVVTADKLGRLAALNAQAEDLIVAADSVAVVERYVEVARQSGRSLQVLLDLEVGGRRTGALEEEAVHLAQVISAADGLEYAGIQGYVGHHQHISDYEARRSRSERLLEPLRRVLDRLDGADLTPTIVSGGGTGTHDFDHEVGLFTEIQAGSYVFMDMNYRDVVLRKDEAHPFDPALSVRTTVISASKPDYVVTDAGIKEIDGIFGFDHPLILRGAPAEAQYSLIGDDMGRVDLPLARETLPLGSIIEVQPPHCYQTAVLYPWYHVVRGDVLEDIWAIGALPA